MGTSLTSILLVTGSVLCAAESAEDRPVDLSGVWSGAGWGRVVIEDDRGTYTDTYGPRPGTFEFHRTGERTYCGTWRESEKRHGKVWFTVLEDLQTIYGFYVADDDCTTRPGSKGAYFLTREKKTAQQLVRVRFVPVDTHAECGGGANWTRLGPAPNRPGALWAMVHAGLGDTFPVQDKGNRTLFKVTVTEATDDHFVLAIHKENGSQRIDLPRDKPVSVQVAENTYELYYPTRHVDSADKAMTSKAMLIVTRLP